MESAYRIFEYPPLKYKNPSDVNYFAFLMHSVDQNYQAENFHFAVVFLHMIYMGIVYHYIYGIFRADQKWFAYVLIGFHDRLQVKEIDNISWYPFKNRNCLRSASDLCNQVCKLNITAQRVLLNR